MALLVFLDANILFSAALGGAAFELLWDLEKAGRVRLVSRPHCFLEAEQNLRRKRPDRIQRFREVVAAVAEVPEAPERLEEAKVLVVEKDALVLAAALGAAADVLITGDTKHFGHLMKLDDPQRPKVRTIRAFLLEGP